MAVLNRAPARGRSGDADAPDVARPRRQSGSSVRIPALDRLRAAALVMMVVHHFVKWLYHGDARDVLPGWHDFVVTDLAAPVFSVAAGASAVLWATRRPTPIPTVIRRYGLLVPLGMLVQYVCTSHVPFDWGVLQALGAGVVASTVVAMIVPSSALLGVFAVVALVAGPLVETLVEAMPGRLADVLGGPFPAITYMGFALAGATGGLLLRRNPERGWQALSAGAALAVVTLVMIEAGFPPDRYSGGPAFVIPGLAGTFLLFGILDRWSAMPAAFGNHTLGIFVAHYAVFWLLSRWGVRGSMEAETAFAVTFLFVLLFAVLAPRVPLPVVTAHGMGVPPGMAASTARAGVDRSRHVGDPAEAIHRTNPRAVGSHRSGIRCSLRPPRPRVAPDPGGAGVNRARRGGLVGTTWREDVRDDGGAARRVTPSSVAAGGPAGERTMSVEAVLLKVLLWVAAAGVDDATARVFLRCWAREAGESSKAALAEASASFGAIVDAELLATVNRWIEDLAPVPAARRGRMRRRHPARAS